MKYVGVRHHENQDMLYWFRVPAALKSKVDIGSEVLCDTRYGVQRGVVERIVEGASEAELQGMINVYSSIKKIVGVYCYVGLDKVAVPADYLRMIPSGNKLERRIRELIEDGAFNTSVIIDSRNVLLDGFTAVLVAKAYNKKFIRALVTEFTDGKEEKRVDSCRQNDGGYHTNPLKY